MTAIKQDYQKFIESKSKLLPKRGIELKDSDLNPILFPFQRFCVLNALKVGKFALFENCGLGKTLQSFEWSFQVVNHTKKDVLILAPPAVVYQTLKEAVRFNYNVTHYDQYGETQTGGIYITNYEQLKNIDTDKFIGIVLDESSSIKDADSKTRELVIDKFKNTPFKLACTATPSPNDEIELGNHSEFLDAMSLQDMTAMFFTTDKDIIKGNKFRLKKHGETAFYEFVSTWAIMIEKPSDIGFDDSGYILPPLNIIERQIETELRFDNGKIFNEVSVSATTFNGELKLTKLERLEEALKIVMDSDEQFIIWVKHDEEAEYLNKLIPNSCNVKGSDKPEIKAKNLLGFADNAFRVLITKTKIAQYGLNYQNCSNQIFASLDFSFESVYQAIRRSYRFGQQKQVNIYLITTDTMQNVIDSINEKEGKFAVMQSEMRKVILSNLTKEKEGKKDFERKTYKTDDYELILGDCVEEVAKLEDESIDYSFFSPPFGALYVFSDDPKDMSNVRNNDEFLEHFRFLVKDLHRVLKSGRLVSIHMMQATTLLGRHGYYSIVDFRGDLIRLFQSCGFDFHAENMIRKDPKTAAIRTKNRQLMHGTTKTDSSIVRPGLADYILTFKKRGDNKVPIQNDIPFDLWCKIAEPIWMEIEESDTLKYMGAKDKKDERHITPTQLKAIEWCYLMWVNKGETVLSPFSGIASEGVKAVEMGIKYKGIELKESYFENSKINLDNAVSSKKQVTLF